MIRRKKVASGTRLLAALLWGLPGGPARATEPPEAGFWLQRDGLRVEVADWLAPPAPELAVDPLFRRCRILLWHDPAAPDPVTAEARGCERGIGRLSRDVLQGWTYRLEGERPATKVQLAEFILIFPLADRPGPVRVFYRPDPALSASLPSGVEVMEVRPTLQAAGAYPLDRVGADTRDTRCRAEVQVSSTGFPEDVLVEGCDDAFVYATERMLRAWTFDPPVLDQAPATGFATYEVAYLRDPADPNDPGQVVVRFPEEPLVAGSRVARVDLVAPVVITPPAAEPWFTVRHEGSAPVRVWEAPLPQDLRWNEAVDCSVRLLTPIRAPIELRVYGCPGEIASALEASAAAWVAATGPIRPGEGAARLDARVRVGPSDPPRLILPAREVESPLPAFHATLGAEAPAAVRTRVPPKVEPGSVPSGAACSAQVLVTDRGQPTQITVLECVPGLEAPLVKAIRKWRWEPALSDGSPVESQETVRFQMR